MVLPEGNQFILAKLVHQHVSVHPAGMVSVLVFLVHTALSGSSGRVWGLCLIKQWLRPLVWTVMSYLVAFLKTPIFTCCFFCAFLSSFWSSVSCFTSRTSSCFRKIILSQMNLHLRLNRLWFAYRFYFYLIVAVKFYLSNTFFSPNFNVYIWMTERLLKMRFSLTFLAIRVNKDL